MTNVQISITVFILAMMVGWNYWYNSPQRVYARQEIIYNSELEELSWSIQEAKRKIESWTIRIQKLKKCIDNKSIVCDNAKATTGSVIPEPPKGYIAKHTLVLTWSNSYVKYSSRVWASWKNNNPSWITWGVSNTLKWLWDNAWISYKKGSPRPANEKGNYVYFETVEDGLKAKIIAIRERWKNATVEHYLGWWGTDDIKLSFDKTKIIKDLSDSEVTELFIQQVKKESPWYISQLVSDNILIIQ